MIHSYYPARFERTWLRSGIKGIALAVVFLVSVVQSTRAQEFPIRGTVTSAADGTPLPGVNIVEVGTQNGTSTDYDGTFSLVLSGPNASVTASFVGFLSQTIEVNGQSNLTIALAEDNQLLDEVVVTAMGIERQERAVGYSVGEVSGEDLREARENNVANALSGKIAGVLVQKPASGPAGSSRVIIRGVTSLGANDNNQPLYVVDGVPIDNTTLGSAGMWGGSDGGDGISSINPDDIENVTVLKSAAAAALYGTRAKNGVILITTKRARMGAGTGIGVEFNSNVSFEDVLVDTDFQTEYGQGTQGQKPTTAQEARDTNQSAWGERLDGTMVVNWDGAQRPYSLIGNNLDRFYETGLTTTNTLALTTATENASVRMSMSYLDNNGISPNSGLTRGTFNLRGTANFGSRLSADAKINFIRESVQNRPRLSDSPGNANFSVYMLAPNVNVEPMRCPGGASDCAKPGVGEDGLEYHPFGSVYTQNPYFAAYQFLQADDERRIIGVTSLKYQFTDWLALQGRFGGDTYTTRRSNIEPYGTAYNPGGHQWEQEYRITEINTDFLFLANKQLTPSIGLTANFGGNILYHEREDLQLDGSGGYNIPNLEVVTNQANAGLSYGYSEKQINSLYGQAELSYNDYLFVNVTGRNDWSSTLPVQNNSYFYPSISASFVFSDAFRMPAWLTFGKARASWAQVGGDTDPYQLLLTYALNGSSHLGQPRGGIAQDQIPLAGLKPFQNTEVELGFDVRFFDSRLGVDFTWYDKTTKDQILATTISSASGFNSQVINAGEITNSGVELLLTTTPVRTGDWRWDVNFNVAKNKNQVVELIEGQTSLVLDESRVRGNFVTADVGEPYGSIKGHKYLRDDQGRLVFDADGLPLQDPELSVLGNGTPDVLGGISTTVRYKRFTLSGLIDMRFGGDIFSALNANAYGAGLHKETLPGREEGFIVGDGVSLGTCTQQEDGTLTNCQANTVQANPQSYYGRIAGQIGEVFVYDASFIKLRELQLSYRLPDRLFRRTPIRLATISLVGRNLWLIHSNVPNLDPESNFRNDSQGIGLEHSGVPQTRSIGFNFNLRL